MPKVHYVGTFNAKDRAGSAYENEFDAVPRRTPAETLKVIRLRRLRRDALVAKNELQRGKT